jgi:hypothetical protein
MTSDLERNPPAITRLRARQLLRLVGFVLVAGIARPARATTANDVCPGVPDPCILDRALKVDAGSTLDFGGAELRMTGHASLDVGGGTMTIKARQLTMQPGAHLLGASGTIAVTTTGDIQVQSNSTTLSHLDVSDGSFGGGEIDLISGGAIAINGVLFAKGTSTEADGGTLDIEAQGDITIAGQLSAKSGSDAGGGDLTILSTAGKITVSVPVDVSGGEYDGGSIDIEAGGDVITAGALDVSGGSLSGSGGDLLLVAGGVVSSQGQMIGTAGGSTAEGGGDGACIEGDAGGDLQLGASVLAPGADGDPGGFGGDVLFTAGRTLAVHAGIDTDAGLDPLSAGLGPGLWRLGDAPGVRPRRSRGRRRLRERRGRDERARRERADDPRGVRPRGPVEPDPVPRSGEATAPDRSDDRTADDARARHDAPGVRRGKHLRERRPRARRAMRRREHRPVRRVLRHLPARDVRQRRRRLRRGV